MSEPLVRLQLIVPESFKRHLKVAAAEHGLTMAAALERWWQPGPAGQQRVAAAEPDEPLPHERNAEIRQEPFLSAFIARSHEVDSSGLCVSWCSACRQSAEAERKADYDKAVRLANEPR